jgi:hypothetical protein
MPIEVATTIQLCDQETFHALDRRIMREVFNIHNEFGRLLDEELYKRELAVRSAAIGILPAEREVQIRVTHQGFTKEYFMDLLFCHGFMFEGKAVELDGGTSRSGPQLPLAHWTDARSAGELPIGASPARIRLDEPHVPGTASVPSSGGRLD